MARSAIGREVAQEARSGLPCRGSAADEPAVLFTAHILRARVVLTFENPVQGVGSSWGQNDTLIPSSVDNDLFHRLLGCAG